MTNSGLVSTKKLRKLVVENAKHMKKYEKSWARHLLKNINYRLDKTDTKAYITNLRQKKLLSHKKRATFLIKLFKEVGAKYRRVENDF